MKHKSSTAEFISAGLFFLAAIITLLANGSNIPIAAMWFCLGLMHSSLGIRNRRRENNEHKD